MQNMYLPGAQVGIQSFHTFARIAKKYMLDGDKNSTQYKHLLTWLEDYETVAFLGGGNCADLENFKKFIDSDKNPYPWHYFHESMDALNGALTNVSIILPEKIHMNRHLERDLKCLVDLDGILLERPKTHNLKYVDFNEDTMEITYKTKEGNLEFTHYEAALLIRISRPRRI